MINFITPILATTTSYWVRVTGACGSVDSTTATITIGACAAPSIVTQPANQTISSGGTATLTLVDSGTEPMTYQWYVGTSGNTTNPMSGETNDYCTTPPLTASTSYWVRMTNACGSTDSDTATVSIAANLPDLFALNNWRAKLRNRGKTVTVRVQVANYGTIPAGPFTVSFYISKTSSFGSDAILFKTVNLTGLAPNSASRFLKNITYTSRRGSLNGRYLILYVDSGNSITESNKTNDISVKQLKVR